MRSESVLKLRNIRMLVLAAAVGLAGTVNSAQAQKIGTNGTNDAQAQEVAIKRDPFWPVGYVPKKLTRVIPDENLKKSDIKVDDSWDEAMKKVVINGVSSRAENAYIAVINGQIKSIGDTVTINHSGTIYTWAVDDVEPPNSVKLRRVSAR